VTATMPACEHCGAPCVPHCNELKGCAWLRCTRCHSYGHLGEQSPSRWRNYDKGAAFNFQTLTDIQAIDTRQLPAKRQAIAGYTD